MRHLLFILFTVLCFSFNVASAQLNLFKPKHGASTLLVYQSSEDSLLDLRLEDLLNAARGQKLKQNKTIDSLMEVRSAIFMRAKRIPVFLPEKGFIPTDSIGPDTNLRSIRKLSVYRKRDIPEIVYQCPNVEELELIYTEIDRLPELLNNLKGLKKLYIYQNRSPKPITFPKNVSIQNLTMRVRDPKDVPVSFKNLRALKVLTLSDNGLKRFPNGGRHNKFLTELNLQRNQITLSNKIRRHRYLQVLALHENFIREVPRSIKNLSNLKKLNFNTNGISKVHPALAKLRKLEQISFYKNHLTAIPPATYSLEKLEQIDLFHNQIEKIDPAFVNWQQLHTLYVSHNRLTELPENLSALKKLEGLYAWDNRLGKLPATLSEISELKYLRVNNNYLKEIPSLERLSKLEEIDLSFNYLSALADYIYTFPNLKILAVTNNRFDANTLKKLESISAEYEKKEVYVHY